MLPGVTVTATNDATGVSRTTTSSGTGDFSIPDLQLGVYTVEAVLQGFRTSKVTIEVTVSRVSSVEIKLGLADVAETVLVSASTPLLDTVSTALSAVVQSKQVQDLPLNGRDFRVMLSTLPGVAGTSVNGVRTRGNNFQIDGADNNDAFQNVSAINQGGVSGIAGTLLPIEAIDQFSVQSGGQAEMGEDLGRIMVRSGVLALTGAAGKGRCPLGVRMWRVAADGTGQGQAASTPLPLAGAPRAHRLCLWPVARGGVAAFSYFMPAYGITEDDIRFMAEVATEGVERATAE